MKESRKIIVTVLTILIAIVVIWRIFAMTNAMPVDPMSMDGGAGMAEYQRELNKYRKYTDLPKNIGESSDGVITEVRGARPAQFSQTETVFLIVDLNSDGIDMIPLAESQVYFDLDNDGLAERTAWVKPDDGFLLVGSNEEISKLDTRLEILRTMLTGGVDMLLGIDANSDQVINENDKFQYGNFMKYRGGVSIVKDVDLNGIPESTRGEAIPCEFISYSFEDPESHVLECKDKSYDIYPVAFEYEDSNVVWKSFCEMLPYGGAQYYGSDSQDQKRCMEQGFKPAIPVWDSESESFIE